MLLVVIEGPMKIKPEESQFEELIMCNVATFVQCNYCKDFLDRELGLEASSRPCAKQETVVATRRCFLSGCILCSTLV